MAVTAAAAATSAVGVVGHVYGSGSEGRAQTTTDQLPQTQTQTPPNANIGYYKHR